MDPSLVPGRKAILDREPRLAEIARGALERSERAPLDHPELTRFAKEMRALLGFQRLPDPLDWAVLLSSGELALKRTVEIGKLGFRRWEGELTLFRRPASGLKRVLGSLLLEPLGESLREVKLTGAEPRESEETEAGEWRLTGRFESVLALREGRSVLIRLAPKWRGGAHFERAHERADDALIEAAHRRKRPPRPTAIPCPLVLPPGGRFPVRHLPRRKRAKR